MAQGDTGAPDTVTTRSARWAPRAFALAACSAALFAQALAAPTAASLPFAPHGDGTTGAAGSICALSPTAFVVSAQGPDGKSTTADDRLLYVSREAGGFAVTPIDTPHAYRGSGTIVRLSASRLLLRGAGADGVQSSADDVLLCVEQLGGEPTVTPILVGPLENSGSYTPTALSARSAVVLSDGPDGQLGTADDQIVLVSDIGGANATAPVTAPFLEADGRHSQPVALSPTSFLVGSAGPDGNLSTDDDLVYLFTDVGGANAMQELAVPHHLYYRAGRAVRVSATRALVGGAGPDEQPQSADDVLWLLDDLGATNDLTPIPIGGMTEYGGGVPCVLTPDCVVISAVGPDGKRETEDDELVIVSGLGSTNDVDRVTVGGIDLGAQSRPVRLSATSVAFAASGPDFDWQSADDEVVVVRDIGGANEVVRRAVGGLGRGSTSRIRPLSATEFLVSTGGPNSLIGRRDVDVHDDTVVHVSLLPGGLAFSSVTLEGLFAGEYEDLHAAVPLGGGRAALVTAGGLDAEGRARVGSGGDDLIEIVSGLPDVRSLAVRRARLRLKPARPDLPARANIKAKLSLDEPALLLGADLTVSIGHAAQTLPSGALVRKGKRRLQYVDKRGREGFIRKLVYDTRKGTLKITARGLRTGLETTPPDRVRVALEVGDLYVAGERSGRRASK